MPAQKNNLPLPELSIADAEVSLDQLIAVALRGQRVKISSDPDWRAKLDRGRHIIEQSLSAGDRVSGVSTCVGYCSGRSVGPEHTQV